MLPSQRSALITRTMAAINHQIAAEHGRRQMPSETCPDLTDLFRRHERPDTSLFFDPPLHPTAEARARIAATMKPVIACLPGDTPCPPHPRSA